MKWMKPVSSYAQIEQWHKDGGLRAECAILYRSNAQSRVLEEALIRAQMPYRIYGGQRFYDRLEIRNALAYLRLIKNRNDDAAMERVFNVPTRGVGAATVAKIRQNARAEGCSMWDSTNQITQPKRDCLPAPITPLIALLALSTAWMKTLAKLSIT